MTQPVKKSSFNLNKNNKIVLAVAALLLCVLIAAGAATVLSNPSDENVTGTPTDKPTPTITPVSFSPTEIHLSSNITAPFYKGDTLQMNATLNVPVAGITVTLLNKGSVVTTAETDASGKVVFERAPLNAFDYSVTATIP